MPGNPNPRTDQIEAYQVKPGEVRNPKGVNGYTKARDYFEEVLQRIDDGEVKPNYQLLQDLMMEMAKQKNTWAMDRLFERFLPAKQIVELQGNREQPIEVKQKIDDGDRAQRIVDVLDEVGALEESAH